MSTASKVFRVVAIAAAGCGGLLGVSGIALAVGGNKYISDGPTIVALTALTAVAVLAAVIAWWHPIPAAFGLVLAVAGYWYALAGLLGPWWDAYQTAVRTSGVAENDFWFGGGTPMALFILAAVCFAVGAVLAFFGYDWTVRESRQAIPTA